jgi:hypothetical protein
MAITATYISDDHPLRHATALHLVWEVTDTHTLCGALTDPTWRLHDETVVGSRACAVCYRNLKARQAKADIIDRAHEGRQ